MMSARNTTILQRQAYWKPLSTKPKEVSGSCMKLAAAEIQPGRILASLLRTSLVTRTSPAPAAESFRPPTAPGVVLRVAVARSAQHSMGLDCTTRDCRPEYEAGIPQSNDIGSPNRRSLCSSRSRRTTEPPWLQQRLPESQTRPQQRSVQGGSSDPPFCKTNTETAENIPAVVARHKPLANCRSETSHVARCPPAHVRFAHEGKSAQGDFKQPVDRRHGTIAFPDTSSQTRG